MNTTRRQVIKTTGVLGTLVSLGIITQAQALAAQLVAGPTFANGVTKKMLHQEWNMGVDEAIEAEAQAQAICMATNDFHRAYHAFVAKQTPVFEGN